MHIGFMLYGSDRTLSGGYLYDRQMADYLRRGGHEVEMISLPAHGYARRLADNLAWDLLDRIAGKDFDLLVQDELCHASLWRFNQSLRRRTRMPIVAVVHHLLSCEPRSRMLGVLLAWPEKRFLRTVDAFIVNSGTTRRAVLSALGTDAKPLVVAQPGGDRFDCPVSGDRIQARAMREGPLRLLFAGLVIARKGLAPLLQALVRVPLSAWRLDVVGDENLDPAYAARVRYEAKGLGLAGNVRFRGVLSDTDLAAQLADSHLLCMPFAYEGFGIVALEALHFGVPVLGSRRGATPELVRDGWNGLLFERNQLQRVADAVQALQADRGRLARLSTNALQSARRHPTWQETMARVELFLLRLVRETATGGRTTVLKRDR